MEEAQSEPLELQIQNLNINDNAQKESTLCVNNKNGHHPSLEEMIETEPLQTNSPLNENPFESSLENMSSNEFTSEEYLQNSQLMENSASAELLSPSLQQSFNSININQETCDNKEATNHSFLENAWQFYKTEQGQGYYVNEVTGESIWSEDYERESQELEGFSPPILPTLF